MSRLTSSNASELIEAYNSVYMPQEEVELTKEQIQENFETWVNSLVEEGYDLSEYTWEEMYESYIEEMGRPGGNLPGGSRPISNAPYQSRFARPRNAGTPQQTGRGTAVSRPQIGSLPSSARQVTQYPQGVSTGVGGGNAGASRPAATPATRPAATPAASRPAATPAARPAATAKPTPTATPAAKPTPTPTPAAKPVNKLMTGMPSAAPSMAAPSGGPTLSARAQALKAGGPKGGGRERMLNQDVDIFDLVKGHLIDEGYADTEEAALAIMANMSEEWKEEIVEGSYEDRIADNNKKYDRARKRAAQRAQERNEARKRGENVGSSRPERTTYTDSAGVKRHHSGAKMP